MSCGWWPPNFNKTSNAVQHQKKDSTGDSKEKKDDADKEDGGNNGEDNNEWKSASSIQTSSKEEGIASSISVARWEWNDHNMECKLLVENPPSFQSNIVMEAAVRQQTQLPAKQTYENQSLQQVEPEKWQLPESPRSQCSQAIQRMC